MKKGKLASITLVPLVTAVVSLWLIGARSELAPCTTAHLGSGPRIRVMAPAGWRMERPLPNVPDDVVHLVPEITFWWLPTALRKSLSLEAERNAHLVLMLVRTKEFLGTLELNRKLVVEHKLENGRRIHVAHQMMEMPGTPFSIMAQYARADGRAFDRTYRDVINSIALVNSPQ